MATDYTDKALDLLAAFGAEGFDYDTISGFHRTRTHDVGSTGWPWEFRHRWEVLAAPATRDALVRQGWIEPLPRGLGLFTQYRVTSKALALLASEATSTWKLTRAPWQAYAVACAAAEADKKAHPNARQRV
jgi:hypothetical protein